MPKVSTITQEEVDQISSQALAASEILSDARFQFVRDYLNNQSSYVEKTILENTIHDVREIVTISDKLTRLFFTPKKVQVDELCGQYKFIKQFFADMEQMIQIKKDLDEAIIAGSVKVNG